MRVWIDIDLFETEGFWIKKVREIGSMLREWCGKGYVIALKRLRRGFFVSRQQLKAASLEWRSKMLHCRVSGFAGILIVLC